MANNTCAQPPALYQGDGSNYRFLVPFPYIEKEDIAVFLWNEETEQFDLCSLVPNCDPGQNRTPTTYRYANSDPVEIIFCLPPESPPTDRPSDFSNVIIIRHTDICQMVAYFYPGSPVRAQDLNNNFTQLLLAIQDVEGNLYKYIENYKGFVRITGDVMEGGPLDMNDFQLTGVPDPTADTDAIPLAWAEDQYVNVDGDTMRGTLNMNNKDLTGVPYPSVDSDAANKRYVDNEINKSEGEAEGKFVNITGDTMTGELAMSNKHIKDVRWPEHNYDAVNKAYVDGILNSGGDLNKVPVARLIFTADGGELETPAIPEISAGNEIVTVNGSTLTPNDDYIVKKGDRIKFHQKLYAGDVVMVLSYNNLKVIEISSNFDTYPFTRWVGVATSGQTVFQGTGNGLVTLGYSIGYEQVTLNGSNLIRGIDYSANDKVTVVLSQGAKEGDILEVLCGNYLKTGDQASYAASDISYTYPNGKVSDVQEALDDVITSGGGGGGPTVTTAPIQYDGASIYFDLQSINRIP